jgi:hypothetical protein
VPSSESARPGQAIARFGEARHAVSIMFWVVGWVGVPYLTQRKILQTV